MTLCLDCPFAMARPSANPRCSTRHRRLFPRTCAWRPSVCAQRPRFLRNYPRDYAGDAGGLRHLPQVTPRKGNSCASTPVHCICARNHRKSDAGSELGTNALWGHHCPRVLQGGSPWPMSGAFHHGEHLHRLRHHPHHHSSRRTGLAQADGAQPGVLRQRNDRGMGLRKHFYRTPVGRTLGEE